MFALADSMMTDMPKWLAKGFIPETPDLLYHTKLLNPGESETLEFTAGPERGDYPYLCTFPGHSRIMQGTLKVE
jgi:azurin